MDPHLLLDARLLFIVVLAGCVSMLTTLNVAARPAAIQTGRVAMAFTISSLFFMVTRFANLFYLPLLGAYVDKATRAGNAQALGVLYSQILWIVAGAAIGALASWLLLPTFVEIYRRGIQSLEYRQSMVRVLMRLARPSGWRTLLGSVRSPSLMGVRLFKLEGIPADFLVMNLLATGVWTVGALCAMLASARHPEYRSTAVLLSGLVNAFAAIAFSIWVDPKAAVITDQAVAGERPARDVTVTAIHLSAGNFFGAMLGMLLLEPGTRLIEWATLGIGTRGGDLTGGLWVVVAINALVTLLASTNHVARVSAVLTRRVATALAIYNVFFLVTRLTQQVYAPVLGSISDNAVARFRAGDAAALEVLGDTFRTVILGASIGVFLGWLLMPTFVEIYNKAIRGLDRLGSVPRLFLELLKPRAWWAVLTSLRPPSTFGVRFSDFRLLPRNFIIGNVVVIAVHTVGVMAAIHAGAQLSQDLGRTATLLSSVVNGVATILLSIVVDPTAALITDQCVAEKRPVKHIYVMAVFLIGGMLLGTLLSQLVFGPATQVIMAAASLLGS